MGRWQATSWGVCRSALSTAAVPKVKAVSSKHSRYYWFNTDTGASRWSPPSRVAEASREEVDEPARKRRRTEKELRVAVIVPYRDLHVAQKRAEHLRSFAPHMKEFLAHGAGNGHKVRGTVLYLVAALESSSHLSCPICAGLHHRAEQ
eukprot:scaffold2875_cov247-Pinguiococcus_pyrenoidosus.AAC.6